MGYIFINRRANGIYINIYIYPKKLQFAAYGQFILLTYSINMGRYTVVIYRLL